MPRSYHTHVYQVVGGIQECKRAKRALRFVLLLDHYVAINCTKKQACAVMEMSPHFVCELGNGPDGGSVYTVMHRRLSELNPL